MSSDTLHFIGFFSGLCSIIALFLYFFSIPKKERTFSLLITSVLIGIPSILFFYDANIIFFLIILLVYTLSVSIFSYGYGSKKNNKKHDISDIAQISNVRTSGHDWIVKNIEDAKKGTIVIDAFGVKVNALYRVIKGSTYKSKLPYDSNIKMRVLFLEPDSHGVNSRSKIENNTKIIEDVKLMKGVWQNLIQEYSDHKFHDLDVKTFNFTPSFYILRVNDKMLVGTYLAESGYENLCFHFEKIDGKTFYQFERFFESIWNSNSSEIINKQKRKSKNK